MSVVVPLAHAGHWIEGAIYFAPVALVVGALAFQSFRDRRAQRRDPGAGERDDRTGETDAPGSEPDRRPADF